MQSPTLLFKRKIDSCKNDFGHVFILAGSLGFTGAATLTAQSCIRAGAGLVTLGIPKSQNTIVATKILEVMTKPLEETKEQTLSTKAYPKIMRFLERISVLAIGPGLSQNKSTQELVKKIVCSNIHIPTVIDADAINALANNLNVLKIASNKQKTIIITPHPKEFARLLNTSTNYVQKNRLILAKKFAKAYNLTIILKGHKTIVCDNKGKCYINNTGNPGMSTAGSGDVLTGIVSALLAQKIDTFNACKLAVYIHGISGDMAKKELGEISLIASDLIKFLPKSFKKLYNTTLKHNET